MGRGIRRGGEGRSTNPSHSPIELPQRSLDAAIEPTALLGIHDGHKVARVSLECRCFFLAQRALLLDPVLDAGVVARRGSLQGREGACALHDIIYNTGKKKHKGQSGGGFGSSGRKRRGGDILTILP